MDHMEIVHVGKSLRVTVSTPEAPLICPLGSPKLPNSQMCVTLFRGGIKTFIYNFFLIFILIKLQINNICKALRKLTVLYKYL